FIFVFYVSARCPFVDGIAGHSQHVSARLAWHRGRARHPRAHPAWARVVSRCRKPKIAKLTAQLLEKLGRLWQRLNRVERVEQITFGRGPRHELRDTQSVLARSGSWPDGLGPESAFLPNQSHKEFGRQLVCMSRRFKQETD